MCVRGQSQRNGVVGAKTQVAISRLGGGAVSVSVKATGGKGRTEASVKFGIFSTPPFQIGKLLICEQGKKVCGGDRLVSFRSGSIYANNLLQSSFINIISG